MDELDGTQVTITYKLMGDSVHMVFIYQGEECNVSIVEHASARKTAAFQAIINDVVLLQKSLDVACRIRNNFENDKIVNFFDFQKDSHIILMNLYLASVVTYAKLFDNSGAKKSQGVGRKRRDVKLEASRLGEFASADQMELHYKIMHLRHEWAAHAGASDNESINAVMVFDPNKILFPTHLYTCSFRAIPEAKELEDFRELCAPVLKLVEKCKLKNEENYFKTPFTPEHLKSMYKNSKKYIPAHTIKSQDKQFKKTPKT